MNVFIQYNKDKYRRAYILGWGVEVMGGGGGVLQLEFFFLAYK